MLALLGVALCLSRGKESVVEGPSELYRAHWSDDRIEEPIIREASALDGLGLETVPVSAQADFQPGEPAAFESLDAVARGDAADDDALGALVEADVAGEAAGIVYDGADCGDAADAPTATLMCVTKCLSNKECRTNDEVIKSLVAANVVPLVDDKGKPCDDEEDAKCYYASEGGSCASATSFGGLRNTHCHTPGGEVTEEKPGRKESDDPIIVKSRYECKNGKCTKVRNSSHTETTCFSKTKCTKTCFEDSGCLKTIQEKNGAAVKTAVFNVLKLYCAKAASRNKVFCFFHQDGKPCTGHCKDGFECKSGKCEAVEEQEATLPSKL